jgi:hypothetical protein
MPGNARLVVGMGRRYNDTTGCPLLGSGPMSAMRSPNPAPAELKMRELERDLAFEQTIAVGPGELIGPYRLELSIHRQPVFSCLPLREYSRLRQQRAACAP